MQREIYLEEFKKINEELKEAKNVLIVSHSNPDADAVGSVLALNLLLKKRGITTFLYLPDSPPGYLNFLPNFSEIKNSINDFKFDFAFCLDYGDFWRLKLPFENINENKIITLDHHLESDQRGKIKIVRPDFSSTAEIIYFWLLSSNFEIDKDIADCLLTGIFSDSDGFFLSFSSSRILKVAGQLFSKGADYKEIIKRLKIAGKSLEVVKIWAKVFSRLFYEEKTGLLFSWVSFEDLEKEQLKISDLTGISNFLSTVNEISVILFLVEYQKGKIKGSLRSKFRKNKNVAKLAKIFNGNGHLYAAGFKTEAPIENVLRKVYNLLITEENSAR